MYILEILFRNGVKLAVETDSKPIINRCSNGDLPAAIGWEAAEPQAELYLQYVNYQDVSAVLVTNTLPDFKFTVDHNGLKIKFTEAMLRSLNSCSDKVTAIKDLRNQSDAGLAVAKNIIEMLAVKGVIRSDLKGEHLTENNPAYIVGQ